MSRQSEDIDKGVGQRSPPPEEPHRERDPQDRGGRFEREERALEEPVNAHRYSREKVENTVNPPHDPDDPAAP